MTQLDRVSCDQSAGMKASVQTRQSPKNTQRLAVEAEECTIDRGYLWWARAVTTRSEKQTICFSEGDRNIDAVFIRLIIAEHDCVRGFIGPVGCVRNLRALKYFRLLLKNRKIAISCVQHKYNTDVPEEFSLHCGRFCRMLL